MSTTTNNNTNSKLVLLPFRWTRERKQQQQQQQEEEQEQERHEREGGGAAGLGKGKGDLPASLPTSPPRQRNDDGGEEKGGGDGSKTTTTTTKKRWRGDGAAPRRWRHSVYGYYPSAATGGGGGGGGREEEEKDEKGTKGEAYAAAADEAAESVSAGTTTAPPPKQRLGRERSRSFSADLLTSSSSSFDSLLPIGEHTELCYPWTTETGPPVPATSSGRPDDGDQQGEPAITRKSQEPGEAATPATCAADGRVPGVRSTIAPLDDTSRLVAPDNSVIAGITTSTSSISPVGGDGRSDHVAGTRDHHHHHHHQQQQREEEDGEEAAREPSVKLKRLGKTGKRRTASGDYLWGCITTEDTPTLPSLSAPSDIVSADHTTCDRLGGTEQEQEQPQRQQQEKATHQPRLEHPPALGTSYSGNGGKHYTERSKKEAVATVGDAKKPKKKRLSLRLFSPLGSTEHTAHTSADGGIHPGGGLLLSRVVNKLTRGSPHGSSMPSTADSLSPSAASTSPLPLPIVGSVSSTPAVVTTTTTTSSSPLPSIPSTPNHGLSTSTAASRLAAVGSGHFRSFSPASSIASVADGRGAPPQPRNAQGLAAPQGREAHLSSHIGAWSGSSQHHQQHWRNKRPVSCSIGEMYNTARQELDRVDERPREPTPTPLTVTTTRSDSPLARREAAALSDGEQQPSLGASTTTTSTASRSRAAMLTTVGSGSIGGVPRRNKLHTGLVGSSARLGSSSSIHGDHRTLCDLTGTAVTHERRNKDNEWRRSWSPSPPAPAEPSSESSDYRPRRALLYRGHHHHQRHHQYQQQQRQEEEDSALPLPAIAIPVTGHRTTTTAADVVYFAGNSSLPGHRANLSRASLFANPPASTEVPEVSPRGRSITISAAPPSGGGDHRVYTLLLDLQLTKYWRIFAEEEILLEDLNDMLEQARRKPSSSSAASLSDLIIDFAMTKWHAKRLLKAVEQLRGSSHLLPAATRLPAAGLSTGLTGSGMTITQAYPLPPAGEPQPSDVHSALGREISGAVFDQRSPTTLTATTRSTEENTADGSACPTSPSRSEDIRRRERKKAKKKETKKSRKKERRKEREKIEREWEKLRQEREKLARERSAEVQAPNKKSIADLEFRELSVADIEWEDHVLAHGRFGVVYRGRWRGVECALKQLRVDVTAESEETERLLKAFKKEASLMQALGYHPNCICFFGAATIGGRLCLVSEWAANGSVYDLLVKRKEDVPLKTLVKLARDAACGILHLHSEKVIHRDIAGKISDLGLSRVMTTTMTADSAGGNIGAIKWMSPESITTNEYSEKSDAFSFGVFLWELLTRETPWGSMPAMQVALLVVNEGKRLVTPDGCDPTLSRLVDRCFASEPRARPDFHEIFSTLNNYHKELESKVEQDATRVVVRPHDTTGGLTAQGGGTNSDIGGIQAEDSEDSESYSDDDCSSSEDDFEQMEMILQYARVGSAITHPGGE